MIFQKMEKEKSMINKNSSTLIVNLFGGPSVGKSTVAAGVFSLLKLHGVECGLVTEYAKDLVWEERHKTFKDQQYIFAKQHHRLWRVVDKVDVIITDSPLILNQVYGDIYKTTNKKFNDNVIDVVSNFNNYNILLTRTKKYNPNCRNQTEDQAKEIDSIIRRTLESYSMGFVEVPGNSSGINKITRLLLKTKRRFKIGDL
ncbi:MAG: hypothetical protein DRI84_04650 [Bacteroidetes bacterium]|nr:MAG: hypothetical protein DRI84_04650 [Bacteroidota bacterium]